MNKQHFFLVLTLLLYTLPRCAESDTASEVAHYSAGLRIQKTHNYHYHNGLFFTWSHDKVLKNHLGLGLSYISSRLGSGIGSMAIDEDYYLAQTMWNFRPGKKINPFARFDMGYYWFDDEGLDLTHSSKILNILTGCEFEIVRGLQYFGVDIGWQQFRETDNLYPIVMGLNLIVRIQPGLTDIRW